MTKKIISLSFLLLAGLLLSAPVFASDSQVPDKTASGPSGTVPGTKNTASEVHSVADKWAFVIGIGRYKDPAISLKYAAKDAMDFYDYLINEAAFARDHVKLLIDDDATRENILSCLGDKWLPRVALPDDLVVIFVSCHGSPSSVDVGSLNYLVTHNTDKNNLYATGIPINDLTHLIKERVHCQRVIAILDACHSGAADASSKGLFRAKNFSAEELAEGTGQMVICSSEPAQTSWESVNYPNGVFTRQLLQGLRQKGTSTTLEEAFQFTRQKVLEEVARDRGELQRPVLRSAWEGRDLRLAITPASPRTGPEEPELPPQTRPTVSEAQVPANSNPVRPSPEVAVAANTAARSPYEAIPAVWKVREGGLGLHFTGEWRLNKATGEFDGFWDNGTQAKIKIVEYDGHHIVLSRRNYEGQYKNNRYRYEGTIETNGAHGTYTWLTKLRFSEAMKFKWTASW
jgi:uncharacterized caspase-like protein